MARDFLHPLLRPLRGHFALESGHHADVWFDLDTLLVEATAARTEAHSLAAQLSRFAPEVICGPLLGGAFVAQLVAQELGCDFLYAAKAGEADKEGLYTARYALPAAQRHGLPGRRVAVVDDVISGGSAVRAVCAALLHHGAQVVAIGALAVNTGSATDWFRERATPLVGNHPINLQLWAPGTCPLCAAGVPMSETP